MRTALSAILGLLAAPLAAGELSLDLPIDCDLGKNCYVQQHVDLDPTAGAVDFQCGTLTYDGHKGTDFAIRTLTDMQRGVDVLAAADGTVAGLRDGVRDVAYSASNAADVDGRECGNGVVLRHHDGWETQYCHMKSGSVKVETGDIVTRGTVLGQVGLSGKTQFPHVHLSVRRNGNVIDPYAPNGQNCGDTTKGLWRSEIPYAPGGLIYSGFSNAIPTYENVQNGTATQNALQPDAKALVLFAYAYGGRKDDVISVQITGPSGPFLTQDIVLDKDQAQLFRAVGKRLTVASWPAGDYVGTVRLMRGRDELGLQTVRMRID